MIQIFKDEAKALRNMGLSGFIKSTRTRYKKYYLVEEMKCLEALKKYRESKIIEIHQ